MIRGIQPVPGVSWKIGHAGQKFLLPVVDGCLPHRTARIRTPVLERAIILMVVTPTAATGWAELSLMMSVLVRQCRNA
jgi:hypothetical protein